MAPGTHEWNPRGLAEGRSELMRRCLLEPIPELELAAKLLDAAADALLLGYTALARELIAEAEMP